MQVKGLRVETIVAIVRAREAEGAFRSLEDFLARVPVEQDEIEALISAGAFDEVCGMTRGSDVVAVEFAAGWGRAKRFLICKPKSTARNRCATKTKSGPGEPGPYKGNAEPAGSRRYGRQTCCLQRWRRRMRLGWR